MSWTSSNSLRLLNLSERKKLKQSENRNLAILDPVSLISEKEPSFSRNSEISERTPIILTTNEDGKTTSQEATPEQTSELKTTTRKRKAVEKAKEVIKDIQNVFIPEE